MADAYARSTSSLGVCVTSTGPAAGNIAGSLVEAYTAGAPLLWVEAMKMEHVVTADTDGVVHELAVGIGQQVDKGQLLCVVGASDDAPGTAGAVGTDEDEGAT